MANYTPNYQLHQWEPEDPFLRADFNQDLSIIDTTLNSLANKAAATAAEAGNCEMEMITYVGTGSKGSETPTRISFVQMPDVFFVVGDMAHIMGRGGASEGVFACKDATTSDTFLTTISGTWSGTEVSYANSINARYQMNSKGKTYWVLGLRQKKQ